MKRIILALVSITLLVSCTGNKKKSDSNTTTEINVNKTEQKIDKATQNKATAKAFLKALEDKNIDNVVALFAENAVHSNPYHSGLVPEEIKGKDAIRAYWQPPFENFGEMRFPIDEIYAMENNGVFVKFNGIIQFKDGSGTYENNYYSTFKFDENGKITEYVEIFNPITVARGFGLLDKIK